MMRLAPLMQHTKNLKNGKFRVTTVVFPGSDLSSADILGPEELGSCLGLALTGINQKQYCGLQYHTLIPHNKRCNQDVRLVANSQWFSSSSAFTAISLGFTIFVEIATYVTVSLTQPWR